MKTGKTPSTYTSAHLPTVYYWTASCETERRRSVTEIWNKFRKTSCTSLRNAPVCTNDFCGNCVIPLHPHCYNPNKQQLSLSCQCCWVQHLNPQNCLKVFPGLSVSSRPFFQVGDTLLNLLPFEWKIKNTLFHQSLKEIFKSTWKFWKPYFPGLRSAQFKN